MSSIFINNVWGKIMSRREVIRQYVDGIIDGIKLESFRKYAYHHTYSVAEYCNLLALQRGLDTELGYIMGLLHDVYAYKTGSYMYHNISGADMVRVVLRHLDFTDEEKTLIQTAILHHDDIECIQGEYDELLKDADLLHIFIRSGSKSIKKSWENRLETLLTSLNIPVHNKLEVCENSKTNDKPSFERVKLGDIAEDLAGKKIQGLKSDSDFCKIIHYFPEASAFDELINAWCAAFVYHCVILANLELPIRYKPTANTRFACVEAWYQWGRECGFCYYEKDGFNPTRGDILIYDSIIPEANKPQNTPWHDHIGIVLDSDSDHVLVAEGNVNNNNISGILTRKRNSNIGCYIRIPDGYQYHLSEFN